MLDTRHIQVWIMWTVPRDINLSITSHNLIQFHIIYNQKLKERVITEISYKDK